MSQSANKDLNEKLKKLEAILSWFESEEISLEESLVKYEEALALSKEIEVELLAAKNQIEIIDKKFSE